jgi:2-keto-4-pentenoate hydratase/2-oxohepta-3-ene-1,7-dioic acid hydratase in catechol pathway
MADTWVLRATELIGYPKKLHLKKIVNGATRQGEEVSDLLFDCAHLVSSLSSGTTFQKGNVIMPGTPSGESTQVGPWSATNDS